MLRPALFLAVAVLSGCVSTAPRAVTAATSEAPRAAEQPLSVRWTRTSAEHDAAFEQTYRLAGERLRAAADTLRGDWGVVLDADETILDNSLYQRERAAVGLDFTAESWDAWVRRSEATALPGATAFTDLVRVLGGRVVVVTNRSEATCGVTRATLASEGVEADAVLCQTGPSDKNARFADVQQGRVPGLPALAVAMWVGDNIQDFPALTQATWARAAGLFGARYWMLPNPMYGSWTRNPDPTEAP